MTKCEFLFNKIIYISVYKLYLNYGRQFRNYCNHIDKLIEMIAQATIRGVKKKAVPLTYYWQKLQID